MTIFFSRTYFSGKYQRLELNIYFLLSAQHVSTIWPRSRAGIEVLDVGDLRDENENSELPTSNEPWKSPQMFDAHHAYFIWFSSAPSAPCVLHPNIVFSRGSLGPHRATIPYGGWVPWLTCGDSSLPHGTVELLLLSWFPMTIGLILFMVLLQLLLQYIYLHMPCVLQILYSLLLLSAEELLLFWWLPSRWQTSRQTRPDQSQTLSVANCLRMRILRKCSKFHILVILCIHFLLLLYFLFFEILQVIIKQC